MSQSLTRRHFLHTAGLGTAAWAAGPALAAAEPARRRPNIVFILMDDMGWMDCGAYGSRYYDTPNIDRLASRGMLFSDAYAANPLCSPTRASILSGQYPARLGITVPVCHLPPLPADAPVYPKEGPPQRQVLCPESRRFLPLEVYTLAEALHDVGYRTAHVGKWHLGQPEAYWPQHQGFDVNIGGGGYPSPPDYFSPYGIQSLPDGPPGEYITDRLTAEALAFLEACREQPFLLCLWHYAVHSPWGHKPEVTATFAGKEDPRGKQSNAVMASMLKSVDDGIGRVLAKLDELGLTKDTIVIFTSDNGGLVTVRADMRQNPPADGENLKPGPRQLREYYRVVRDTPPTNNEPLRGGKATLFEGGQRVPLIVCWPGVVEPGSRCSQVVSSVDHYPTLLEVTGATPKPGQPVDGESLLPLWRQAGKLRRDAIFCHFPHVIGDWGPAGTSVRRGDWKLIRVYDRGGPFPEPFLLYNLREDLSETRNLAAQHPELVRELDALIDRFVADTGALLPIPNPAYDPNAVRLGGWVDKTQSAAFHDGLLALRCAGPQAFIANASLKHRGEAVFRFRIRSPVGGPGKMQWRTAAQKDLPAEQVVAFEYPGDNQWHEIEVRLPVQGELPHVRLYPVGQAGPAELDWIRLYPAIPAATPEQEWTFE